MQSWKEKKWVGCVWGNWEPQGLILGEHLFFQCFFTLKANLAVVIQLFSNEKRIANTAALYRFTFFKRNKSMVGKSHQIVLHFIQAFWDREAQKS